MRQKQPTISVITVNYQSARYLRDWALSLSRHITLPYESIVVDNSRELHDRSWVDQFDRLTLLDQNIGFGGACNHAFSQSRGRYLFFLNPDAQLMGPGMEDAIEFMEMHPHIGILGFDLVDREGNQQPWTAGRDISLWQIVRNKLRLDNIKADHLYQDWVSGAALLIRRDVFGQVGGFDARFFLYFEDADLCRRVRKSGYGVSRFPSVRVLHIGGGSFSQRDLNQKKSYYQSQDRYFSKYRSSIEGLIVRFLRKILGFEKQ